MYYFKKEELALIKSCLLTTRDFLKKTPFKFKDDKINEINNLLKRFGD